MQDAPCPDGCGRNEQNWLKANMMAMNDPFFTADEGQWTTPEPGIERRIMLYNQEMMMVEVAFEAGATGTAHSHPHVQSTYVAAGRFEVTIDGQTQVIGEGGAFLVAPDLVHGVKALEAGRLIDTFSPMREDFV